MFNATEEKAKLSLSERERGERVYSQRASLKVNVSADRNKKECVKQMKGTRYRHQAGRNLSERETVTFYSVLTVPVDLAPERSGGSANFPRVEKREKKCRKLR